jgi:ribosomal protein S27E
MEFPKNMAIYCPNCKNVKFVVSTQSFDKRKCKYCGELVVVISKEEYIKIIKKKNKIVRIKNLVRKLFKIKL